MKRIAVFLTEKQIEALRTVAQDIGIPMAEALRRLLDEGLQRAQQRRAPHTQTETPT